MQSPEIGAVVDLVGREIVVFVMAGKEGDFFSGDGAESDLIGRRAEGGLNFGFSETGGKTIEAGTADNTNLSLGRNCHGIQDTLQ